MIIRNFVSLLRRVLSYFFSIFFAFRALLIPPSARACDNRERDRKERTRGKKNTVTTAVLRYNMYLLLSSSPGLATRNLTRSTTRHTCASYVLDENRTENYCQQCGSNDDPTRISLSGCPVTTSHIQYKVRNL